MDLCEAFIFNDPEKNIYALRVIQFVRNISYGRSSLNQISDSIFAVSLFGLG